jgi:hypothetical protein
VEIVGRGSNRCVDVTDGAAQGGKDGKRLELWDCSGAAWQRWVIGQDGTIRSLNLCMDVIYAGTSDGTGVQLANCSGDGAQQWQFNQQSGQIVNPESGKCLDAFNQGTANGTQLQIWDCNGQGNQNWYTRQ